MTDVPMLPTEINGRWELLLPEHRHLRPEWPWWEAARLAAEHHVITGLAAERRNAGVLRMPFDLTDEQAEQIKNDWLAMGNQRPAVLTGDADDVTVVSSGRPVVWVAGAEEGDFPALYSSWGADVVLAEPNPRVWPNIKAIWQANDLRAPLACWTGFLSDEDTHPEVLLYDEPGAWPPSAHGPVIGDHGFCRVEERPDLPAMRIDTMAAVVAPPDVLTIDVEGAEAHVLRGAARTLAEHRPHVFVSVHDEFARHHYGYDNVLALCNDLMRDAGYPPPVHLATDHEAHWWWAP